MFSTTNNGCGRTATTNGGGGGGNSCVSINSNVKINLPDTSAIFYKTKCGDVKELKCLNIDPKNITTVTYNNQIFHFSILGENRNVNTINNALLIITVLFNFERIENTRDARYIVDTLLKCKVPVPKVENMDNLIYKIGINMFYKYYCYAVDVNKMVYDKFFLRDLTMFAKSEGMSWIKVCISDEYLAKTILFIVNFKNIQSAPSNDSNTANVTGLPPITNENIKMNTTSAILLLISFFNDILQNINLTHPLLLIHFSDLLHELYSVPKNETSRLMFANSYAFRIFISHLQFSIFQRKLSISCHTLNSPFMDRLIIHRQLVNSNNSLDCNNGVATSSKLKTGTSNSGGNNNNFHKNNLDGSGGNCKGLLDILLNRNKDNNNKNNIGCSMPLSNIRLCPKTNSVLNGTIQSNNGNDKKIKTFSEILKMDCNNKQKGKKIVSKNFKAVDDSDLMVIGEDDEDDHYDDDDDDNMSVVESLNSLENRLQPQQKVTNKNQKKILPNTKQNCKRVKFATK